MVRDGELLDGRYEVLRTVSDGRRASVLQALDHRHDQMVALKVFPVADAERGDLLAEAQLLMNIDGHRGLPAVRGDFFTDDGQNFVVVLKWIDGIDLQQTLDEQGNHGLPLPEVIEMVDQVAAALDHLHAHDPPIVHGDVKPANLVRTSTRVVLVDFDIAGTHAGKGRVGTVGFVAPEVAAGEKPGPAADVYGLAATVIALLSGHPPTDELAAFPTIPSAEQGQVRRVVRAALSVDPSRRPASAGQFVANLRAARRDRLPSGRLAFLAYEVDGAARMWSEDADEMRVAMSRLRDLRDEVLDGAGGIVVTTMNEGDRTIAVFTDAAAAVAGALGLHQRVAQEEFPPGFGVRLRVAVAVGDATPEDGMYTGAVVDHVVGLRSAAETGTTITSEPTAELLANLDGVVGSVVSIVPLGVVDHLALSKATRVFALTRPGEESGAGHRGSRSNPSTNRPPDPPPSRPNASRILTLDGDPRAWAPPSPPEVPPSAVVTNVRALKSEAPVDPDPDVAMRRRTVLAETLQEPSTLVTLTALGCAWIFFIVLAAEFEMRAAAALAVVLLSVGFVAIFGRNYSRNDANAQRCVDDERQARESAARAADLERERRESRERLQHGFARVGGDDGSDAQRVLDDLGDEFDSIGELLRRDRERTSIAVAAIVPDLVDETYRHGMSALSDALEFLELADGRHGRHRRNLEVELRDVEDRLERNEYVDERSRARDEQVATERRRRLAKRNETRHGARDLVFEAERCSSVLSETRIELASLRAGDTQVDVDAVVESLQQTIKRVRDVQIELRRLGY